MYRKLRKFYRANREDIEIIKSVIGALLIVASFYVIVVGLWALGV